MIVRTRHAWAVAILLLALAACAGPAGGAAATAQLTRQPVTVGGKGELKSDPFHLSGTYGVTWTAKADSDVGCFHGARLERADGATMNEDLVTEIFNDATEHTGATNVYNLADASYFVSANSGCAWSFTFTPK